MAQNYNTLNEVSINNCVIECISIDSFPIFIVFVLHS